MLTKRRLSLPLVAAALLLSACSPANPAVTTVGSVDLARYSGLWYEVASVKQFFSIGLVNTTATYTPRPDGAVGVLNRGRYFGPEGPESSINGAAVPVDSSNARLNVGFGATPSNQGMGNYWIIDLDEDYQWAAVSDPSGSSFFLLSRTKTFDAALKAEIISRAEAKGVAVANITDTPQF